jgi:hypothetical protein
VKFTKRQRLEIANFGGSAGTGQLSPVQRQLVRKGVFATREDFMISIRWGEGWDEERGLEVRRELAEEVRPQLSDEAVEALLAREFHDELREHGLGFDRGKGRLMRQLLGAEVARIVEEERGS